jgi:outer membrane lipopolysaccharide assembly protein LptE/RlpB
MINYLKYLVLACLFLVFNGCGFHLRQNDALPIQLRTMYLQSPDQNSQFTISLKQVLLGSGVSIVDKPQDSVCIFEIISADIMRSGTNVYSSAQASVYTFTFTVVFKLIASSETNTNIKNIGKTLLASQKISVSRNLTLNPNEILEASNQVGTITNEMQREVILKILNILESKEVVSAFK